MSALDPNNTTATDLCIQSLRECGAWGVGQTPLADDIADARMRFQWMLQEWERKRWLVYHLVTYSIQSTGAETYTIGPGGDIDISNNPFNAQFGPQFGGGALTTRPNKIESAFARQLVNNVPNQVDYPLELVFAREDYNRIALKSLTSFPQLLYYDNAWPLGVLYPWPVLQASIYSLFVTVRAQLPVAFANSNAVISLPYEYYGAILYNLAIRLRPKYGIVSKQGDHLPGLAKDALNAVRTGNAQIARLRMPRDLNRPGVYNIYSDQTY